MIKNIKPSLSMMEYMLYFWQSNSENEKVGEQYLSEIASQKEMATLYDDEFTEESVRKVLSAITNREMLNGGSKKERKFWNNNMWVTEDMELLHMMMDPIKVLNAQGLVDKINAVKDIPFESVEIIFIPGLEEEYSIQDNQLFINFFRVTADLYEEGKVTIGGKALLDFIEEKILEMA